MAKTLPAQVTDSIKGIIASLQSVTVNSNPNMATNPNLSRTTALGAPGQAAIDAQSIPTYHAVFHSADKYPLQGMASLQTKRIHEAPIGDKYNVNSEAEQVQAHRSLNQIGLNLLQVPEAQAVASLRGWQTKKGGR